MELSKFDIIDMFEAYTVKATFVNGNQNTEYVVALEDVKKIVEELVIKLDCKKCSKEKVIKVVPLSDVKKIVTELVEKLNNKNNSNGKK